MNKGYSLLKALVPAIILLGLTGTPIPAQVQIKTGNGVIDHRVVKGETVNLEIRAYRGTLQWQQSTDGANWNDWPGKTLSAVQFLASDGIWLRIAVKSENCDPVYSEVVHIIPFQQPDVQTAEVTAITTTGAQCGGDVTDDGGDPVTARGVCWSLLQSPTIDDAHTQDGAGTGVFVSVLDGLSPNTGATNESLFSGRPAGWREYHGYWGGIGEYGFYWSSYQLFPVSGGAARLFYNLAELRIGTMDRASRISVRCLKNQ